MLFVLINFFPLNYKKRRKGGRKLFFLKRIYFGKLCELFVETGIDFAKTATGRDGPPQMHHMEAIVNSLKGSNVRIKVAGIKDPRPQNAIAYLKAGADVLGSQQVFSIIDDLDLMRRMNQI